MILPIVLLITGVVALLAFFLYGRAYWWAYRASRWREVDQAIATGSGDGMASPARRLTRQERNALGTPFSNAFVALLAIFSAYGAIALFRSGDPTLAIYSLICSLGLISAVLLFVFLDRLPTVVRARTLKGVLTYPSEDLAYVPPGGRYVGGVPVLYPLHWEPFIQADAGKTVEIELTEQGDVLRHGSLLALDQESSRFNIRPWVPAAHAAVALTVLFVAGLFVYAPIGERVDAARQAWAAHRYLIIDSPADWHAWEPRVGDEIIVRDVQASCVLAPSAPEGLSRAGPLSDCSQVAVGLAAPEQVSMALTPTQLAATRLSGAMEQFLLTRRNATSQEVRRVFRQSGIGSSQRYTLTPLDVVERDIDTLCAAQACAARDALAAAAVSPAAQSADQVANTLVLDGASATRLIQASFALAAESLDTVLGGALAQAQTHQHSAQRVLHSVNGTPLAQAPSAYVLPNAADQALVEQIGTQSPRLRLLLLQQALQQLDRHDVEFSGVVREVDATARPQRVMIDTTVTPAPVWVKIAPLVLLASLALLAVLAGALGFKQWRTQQRNLALITAHYQTQRRLQS